MATIAKSGTPSPSTRTPPPSCQITGLVAGEAIAAGDAIYLKSDGKWWLANGTAATAPSLAVGIAPAAASVGEAVSCYFGMCFHYGAGMTPGVRLYVSATPGALDDAATTGGSVPFAIVVDANRIFVLDPQR
jgi:hypothetical protein